MADIVKACFPVQGFDANSTMTPDGRKFIIRAWYSDSQNRKSKITNISFSPADVANTCSNLENVVNRPLASGGLAFTCDAKLTESIIVTLTSPDGARPFIIEPYQKTRQITYYHGIYINNVHPEWTNDLTRLYDNQLKVLSFQVRSNGNDGEAVDGRITSVTWQEALEHPDAAKAA